MRAKTIQHSADFIKKNMKKIGEGTESETYFDGNYAYKVVKSDLVPEPADIIKNHVGKNYKNVSNMYDAWKDPEDYTIIKMEKLEKLPTVTDEEEFEKVQYILWTETFDEIIDLPYIAEDTKDPEIKKMVQSIYDAAKELNITHMDIGFHNLMYDPKTDEYKQIDIF